MNMSMHCISKSELLTTLMLIIEIPKMEKLPICGVINSLLDSLKILRNMIPTPMILRTDFHTKITANSTKMTPINTSAMSGAST